MKYWEDFVCGTIIIVIGVLIIFPPKPEPVCPMCGPLTKFLFSDIYRFGQLQPFQWLSPTTKRRTILLVSLVFSPKTTAITLLTSNFNHFINLKIQVFC